MMESLQQLCDDTDKGKLFASDIVNACFWRKFRFRGVIQRKEEDISIIIEVRSMAHADKEINSSISVSKTLTLNS